MLNWQAAEDIDKQRKDAEEQRDAQAKSERSERAKRNAELVAQQKVADLTAETHEPCTSQSILYAWCATSSRI